DSGALRATVLGTKEKALAAAASTSGLVDRADSDPRSALDALGIALRSLDEQVAQADEQLKKIQTQTASYFGAWEKDAGTITDAELKKRAEARRAELAKAVTDVCASMSSLHARLAPFTSPRKDPHGYWSNDLSPSGVKSAADKAAKTCKYARTINEKLDEIVKVIDAGAPEFRTAKAGASATSPPPPPTASRSSTEPDA